MPAVLVLVMIAVAAALGVQGFSEVVAVIAKATFFIVPTVFSVSLVLGLASRKRP
jgi:uncharacterized membrane protein YtjA (UPF0391 family)